MPHQPLAAFKSLSRLMLSKIPAKDLSPVGQLAELTELTIDETDFADYTPLAKCTKLRTLQAQLPTLDKLDIQELSCTSERTF